MDDAIQNIYLGRNFNEKKEEKRFVQHPEYN